MNREPFCQGEFYHIYNQGVEKRNIFSDEYDSRRFLESMEVFNDEEPVGSIFEHSLGREVQKLGGSTPKSKLVNIIAYCLNPNHFHLILEQVSEKGISEFMKRLSGGYTSYFNIREKRRGVLFSGRFRSRHIATDEYLLHLSAYVNLNDRVHKIDMMGDENARLVLSSWEEYMGHESKTLCKKDIILGRFKNSEEYKEYAEGALEIMLERKQNEKEAKYYSME